MRKRTQVVAAVFMGISLYMFYFVLLFTPSVIMYAFGLAPDTKPDSDSLRLMIGAFVGGLEWPFWWMLLRRKPWAWKVLVVVYCASVLERIWTLGTAPAYYAAHPQLDHTTRRFALTLLWAALGVGVPLWALVTDKPDRWSQPANPQSYTGSLPG